MCGYAMGAPFARHNEHSTAGYTLYPDCDLGSGVLLMAPTSPSWKLTSLATTSEAPVRALLHASIDARIGEALHPGPVVDANTLRIGVSNPGGLRRKELEACSLGPGIWSFSETHLSVITQKSCATQLRSIARQAHRDVRVYHGAPVQTRCNSTWAGTWSGVSVMADFPGRILTLPFGHDVFASGRVLCTMHYVNDVPVQLVSIYGYPRGPTWPDARSLNHQLLQVVSDEVVLGGNGIRIILGDFNETEQQGSHFPLWSRMGWQNAQTAASHLLNWDPQATSFESREIDMIWLSPEALALMSGICLHDVFSGHKTLEVQLRMHQPSVCFLSWPTPSAIPWAQVEEAWPSRSASVSEFSSSTEWFQAWALDFETSLDGHVRGQPGRSLTSQQKGRGSLTAPVTRQVNPPLPKPSREGELKLKSDAVGTSVRLWFTQLRRFQSLAHAVRAGSLSHNASVYQAEVWAAIKRARGFSPDFATWWRTSRQFDHPDAPSVLPCSLPSLSQLEGMLASFRSCFEAFEAWHIRQRRKLLRNKHERTMQTLHEELRSNRRDQVDFLQTCHEYTILATDEANSQVALDRVPDLRGHSLWLHQDTPCQVSDFEDVTCRLQSEDSPEPMDSLFQQQYLTSTEDIQMEFVKLWEPRWKAATDLSDSDWERFHSFTRSFVPSVKMEITDITLAQWKRALKRFKPRAAIGVDGFSHRDLLRLPDEWTLQLLHLLHQIERAEMEWPAQLLYGKVISLAKRAQPLLPDHYRPVVIFSTIYRTWSSVRSRQLIAQIAPLLERFHACGFLPGKETAMYWLGLQADLEQICQSGSTLLGMSTDLQKAFNHIPRRQTALLAQHIGVPERIIHPWMLFLQRCIRSFVVRLSHGPSVESRVGMPEGDALSVYAMIQLDLAWRCYLMAFHPAIQSWSFVDNLSWTSTSPGELAAALVGAQTFFQMWNLTLDDSKTLAWSTSATSRKHLRLLGFQTVDAAAELGGLMSYSCRRRVGAQLERASALEPRWMRLRLSLASTRQKLVALMMTFWPTAMRGAANAPFNPKQLGGLRTQALRALGLQKAGVNPLLRLSLSGIPLADPGFYQLRMVVCTFLRIARKMPELQQRLKHVVTHFDGKPGHGPCHTLLDQFTMLGWRLEPPFFFDHDGLCFHLFTLETAVLEQLLWEGWLQMLARQVTHRRTMASLHGIDPDLVSHGEGQLCALDRSLRSALQSGAFMAASNHAKYDPTKVALCQCCGVPDGQDHWIVCQRFSHLRDDSALQPAPATAWSTHLLPDRNPFVVGLKQYFHSLPVSFEFLSEPTLGCQHLFTDGSFVNFGGGYHGIAAWGVFNSSSQRPVMAHHLGGLAQSIDRAELSAILGAVSWGVAFSCAIHIWSDSQYAVHGFHYLLQHSSVPMHWANQGLWLELCDLLHGSVLVPGCSWIPSHMDADQCEDAFADWVQLNNDHADRLAVTFNFQRSAAFWRQLCASLRWLETGKAQLGWLQSFYFRVAKVSDTADDPVAPLSLTTEQTELEQSERLGSFLPNDWVHFIVNFDFGPKSLPQDFYQTFLGWLVGVDQSGDRVQVVSHLELVMALLLVQSFSWPHWNVQQCSWVVPLTSNFTRPTVATLVSYVSRALRDLAARFDFVDLLVPTCFKQHLGIVKPMGGIKLHINSEWQLVHSAVQSFTSSRPIRRSCDLARPVPACF